MKESELLMASLISGSGTTMEATIKAYQEGKLGGVRPVVVIASRPEAPGLQKAKNLGVETKVVGPGDFATAEAFGEKLLQTLNEYQVDLLSQNGWLPQTPENVVKAYQGMAFNQHPGPLDPGRSKLDFGGKGMYGSRVTCTRVAFEWVVGEKHPWTEATTHYVTENYDEGDLIRVVRLEIPLLGQPVTVAELRENPQTLVRTTKEVQKELLPLEHENVIATLQAFAESNQRGFRRNQPLVASGQEKILFQAKKLAKELFPEG